MINNTYLNDYGIIIKILDDNFVLVTSLQKRMGVFKTIRCKYLTPCSSSFAIQVEPVVGDKVRITSLKHLQDGMFEAEEPLDAVPQNGYGEMSCVCVPAGSYKEDAESKVKIRLKQESVEMSSEIPVTLDCGVVSLSVDPEGDVSLNNDSGSVVMAADGTVEINNNFKVLV